MPLNSKLQQYVDEVNALKDRLKKSGFKQNQLNHREAVANFTSKYMTYLDSSVMTIDDVVAKDGYNIPIRIYIPTKSKDLSVIAYMHGGGHMTGSVSVYDGIITKMSKVTNHIIVAIEYRLSPEFRYPVGLEDCKFAVKNIFDILSQNSISCNQNLTIMGDSAGGAICASMTMDEDFIKTCNIKNQVLLYPSLDYTSSMPSVKKYETGYLLDKDGIDFYFSNYFNEWDDKVLASPLFGRFYKEMPLTLVIACEYDPLSDEAYEYFKKMQEVGACVEYAMIKGAVHPLLMLEDLCTEECKTLYGKVASFLNGCKE